MEKPILLWDRSECHAVTCTCHDDSSTPRLCSGCGCNVASPGHRNTLDTIDRQAARIRELEGALAEFVATDDEMPVIPWSNESQAKWFDRLYTASRNARRILEGGKP